MNAVGEKNSANIDRNEFLTKLCLEHRARVARYIKAHIYSNEYSDVEDCVQEVFVTAVKKAQTTDIESYTNIVGWLLSIAKIVLLRFNKAYLRTKHNVSHEYDTEWISYDNDFTRQLIEDIVYDEIDLERFIDDLTKMLPEIDRFVFMQKLGGKTNKEISVILNISEDAVASRYKRSRQKLKIFYKKLTPL